MNASLGGSASTTLAAVAGAMAKDAEVGGSGAVGDGIGDETMEGWVNR